VELLRAGKPFTQENLFATYVARRHASSLEREAEEAKNARNGFHGGLVRGLIGMALAGLTHGKLSLGGTIPSAQEQIHPFSPHKDTGVEPAEAARLALEAQLGGRPLHDALMTARGWPEIELDGRLLVTQQDALLMGGKVQAMPGFADHVVFRDPQLCAECAEKTCIAMCSGQAITQGADNSIAFEREKCVHCGACLWNCAHTPFGEHANIDFRAGSGGLHSAEN
jgi:electron-transferring-flavoprotein dehydrogenase